MCTERRAGRGARPGPDRANADVCAGPGPTSGPTAAATPALELRKGDRVVLVGNTLAERMQLFNHFETLLHARFAELQLVVRNLGWSGDTITLQPRPLNFGDARVRTCRSRRPTSSSRSSAPTSRSPAKPGWRSSSGTSTPT